RRASRLAISGKQPLRKIGAEIEIVVGIDPQARHLRGAELRESRHESRFAAVMAGGRGSVAAGEAYDRDKTRYVARRCREPGHASGRLPDAKAARAIDGRLPPEILHGAGQVSRGFLTGVNEIGIVAAPISLLECATRLAEAAANDDRRGPAAARKAARLGQEPIRPNLPAQPQIARGAMGDHGQRK